MSMDQAIEKKLFYVWLALSGITLLSYWLGTEQGGMSGEPNAIVTYVALAIVAVKVRVIVVEFMEARRTSKRLQFALDVWLFLLVASLSAIYALKLQMPAV